MFITDFICPVLVVLTCLAIIIMTFYGVYIKDEILQILGFIGMVFILLFLGITVGLRTTVGEVNTQSNKVNQEEIQSKPEDTYEPLSGCTTHVAAEIYEQYQNEDGTYSNVFEVDYSEVQAFIWISEKPLPDDVPYLLTMDNKGTLNNPLDDEILVVWMDVN